MSKQSFFEAVQQRHSVRAYLDKPLAQDVIDAMQTKIDEINTSAHLHVQLVVDEPKAFQSTLAKYGKFSNVNNYVVMAGTPDADFDERIGYYGEQLVLLAQTLGLNTCWVGLTYSKVVGAYTLSQGEKISCVIAIGYGATQGIQHKSKPIHQVSNYTIYSPSWFRMGVESAQLAPTAVNQQKFYFELQPDGKTVSVRSKFSLAGYTKIDIGIAKLHFEIGVQQSQHTKNSPCPFVWK